MIVRTIMLVLTLAFGTVSVGAQETMLKRPLNLALLAPKMNTPRGEAKRVTCSGSTPCCCRSWGRKGYACPKRIANQLGRAYVQHQVVTSHGEKHGGTVPASHLPRLLYRFTRPS